MRRLVRFHVLVFCLALSSAARAQFGNIGVGGDFGWGNPGAIGWGMDGNMWGQAATIDGDFLRWLGSARLQTAQSEYWQAQSAGQWQRARALNSVANALERDLFRANQHINATNRSLTNVNKHIYTLNAITIGRISTTTIIAVRSLLSLLPPPVVETLLTEAAMIPALSAADFKPYNKTQTKENPETGEFETHDVVLQDFPGGNVFAFVAWLGRIPVIATMGSPGHTALMKMRNILLAGATEWRDQALAQRTAYENRHYDIWQPVSAGGFTFPERRLP